MSAPTPEPAPLDLDALERLASRATDGPWRVVLDDTESATTVWRVCTSPDHPNEDDPGRIGVYDCCADGGLHSEPWYREADAELIAAARNALPELIRLARTPQTTLATPDLAALARLADVADLPWETDGQEITQRGIGSAGWVGETLHTDDPEATRRYAEYIVAAANAVPALVAELTRLRPVVEQRDKLVGVIAHLVSLPPEKIAEIYQVGYGAAVAALGPDAPVEPARAVLDEVAAERARQDRLWGEQSHPDGTGGPADVVYAGHTRWLCERATADGTLTWRHILREEVYEALAEADPARRRAELIQVAAVAVQWVEAIDRRGGEPR